MTPLDNSNSVYGQEFMKGEVSGLRLIFAWVDKAIEALTDEEQSIRNMLEVEQAEADNENGGTGNE